MNYIEENRKVWDERSNHNDTWSIPVTSEMIQLAREGVWSIVLTPTKIVPPSWFPENLNEKKILCLASGVGQQGPILSATGADVTVFDNSNPFECIFNVGKLEHGILLWRIRYHTQTSNIWMTRRHGK